MSDASAQAPVSLEALFLGARSHNGWLPRPVTARQLQAVYELARWGPTSANCCPMRIVFVTTDHGREKLRPWLSPGNVEKAMTAPATAIIGYDLQFHRRLGHLFPHNPALARGFEGEEQREHAMRTAFRNGTLQAAYLMLAARSLGLDCGPMSGFDADGVDGAFWAGTSVRTNFLCNLGYGDHAKLFARLPRLAFDEACRVE